MGFFIEIIIPYPIKNSFTYRVNEKEFNYIEIELIER